MSQPAAKAHYEDVLGKINGAGADPAAAGQASHAGHGQHPGRDRLGQGRPIDRGWDGHRTRGSCCSCWSSSWPST